MSEQSFELLETSLQAAAHDFPYPLTPDIARAVRQRLAMEPRQAAMRRMRLAWAAAIAVLILAGLLAVPQVRAAVLEALRIGAIRIFLTEPTPTSPRSRRRRLRLPRSRRRCHLRPHPCRHPRRYPQSWIWPERSRWPRHSSASASPSASPVTRRAWGRPIMCSYRRSVASSLCWSGWTRSSPAGCGSACTSWGQVFLRRKFSRASSRRQR